MERSLESLINPSKQDHMASRTIFPLLCGKTLYPPWC